MTSVLPGWGVTLISYYIRSPVPFLFPNKKLLAIVISDALKKSQKSGKKKDKSPVLWVHFLLVFFPHA